MTTNQLQKPSISVFFPCYNDANSIGKLISDAFVTLKTISSDYEVIVIDDGSRDESPEVLKKLKNLYPKLKIIFHKRNQGYGGALRSGFQAASKDLVFYTDGDGQYDVKEVAILASLMSADVDFVNGIKMYRKDSEVRIILGNLHRFIMRWAFWLPTTDVDCDFRLIRRSILGKIKINYNTGAICVELVKKAERAGAQFREVDVHHYKRQWGKSQFFRMDRILLTYKDLASLWVRLMIIDKLLHSE